MKLKKFKENTSDNEIVTDKELLSLFLPEIEALIDKKIAKDKMQIKIPEDDSGTFIKLPYRIPPSIKENVVGLVADARDGKLKAFIGGKWYNIKLE